jgi:tetratricopeptide (TPR) repeat protein
MVSLLEWGKFYQSSVFRPGFELMGILDSLNGDQDRQRLQLLADQYKAIGDQLLTEQNPVMRPILETQQKQIAAQIQAIEAKPAVQENAGTSHAPEKRRFLGAEVLPAVTVWHGRDALVRDLVSACADDRRNVIALLGQGGMGKSSLATKLVEALGIEARSGEFTESCGFDCAIAFKAFEGSSFDEVAAVLLAGLGIREAGQNSRETIAAIVRGLGQVRALVVLDNLESVLQPPKSVNPGRAVSLEWGDLLNGLAIGSHRSLVILTSREFPADLADRRHPDGLVDPTLVCLVDVREVEIEASIAILREYGFQESDEDLRWIADRVQGQPFLLKVLASYATMPGYIRQHPDLLVGGVTKLLEDQLKRQPKTARSLLQRMCVLRVPINARGLTFLRLHNVNIWSQDLRMLVANWRGKSLESAISDKEITGTVRLLETLASANLVQKQYELKKQEFVFDLHRIVVDFVSQQLGEARSGLLGSVYQFYRSGRTVENPKTLDDLQPLLEAQYFAFQLGNYSEAKNLIYELEKYLNPWGYWALYKELCEQILPHLDRASQPYILQRIGSIYRDWGDWNQAETYYQQALDLAKAENDRGMIASLQGNLGDIERKRGNWDEAERLFRQCLELRTELGDRSGMATSWGVLGDIERYRGNWDEAERLYRQSLELRTELGDRSGMAMTWGLLGDIERYRGNWDEAERLYRQSLELRTELGDQYKIAEGLGDFGDLELDRQNLDLAESYFSQALEQFKKLNSLAQIAYIEFRLAQLWQRRNNPDRAQHHYTIARDLYTQLGAAKDLERIETEFNPQ